MRGVPSGRLQLAVMQYGAGGWRLLVVPAAKPPLRPLPYQLCCRPPVIEGAEVNGQECPWLTVAYRTGRARNGTEMAWPVRTTRLGPAGDGTKRRRWARPILVIWCSLPSLRSGAAGMALGFGRATGDHTGAVWPPSPGRWAGLGAPRRGGREATLVDAEGRWTRSLALAPGSSTSDVVGCLPPGAPAKGSREAPGPDAH
jgi:hypothetical protein